MSYLTGFFARKEGARKALRDQKRDEFFAEFEGSRLTDPFDLDVDAQAQKGVVSGLIAQSLSLHNGDTSAITQMQSLFEQLDFGIPSLPIGRPHQIKLTDTMPEDMLARHFSMGWAGWLDD
ncbi:hypothetical protein [Leisingera sp. ANG-M7]|uniref:hypothetical protein n=1 Tax=Leisingera sp. ANG-M7 TaxID=1577902 RepID=UPI00057F976D|nr:hypothetical protein [Leisingera sp. ANG-M7]KIC39476.1 hypothetical protein RA26_02220 [Leisingera sp. ANG-M7]